MAPMGEGHKDQSQGLGQLINDQSPCQGQWIRRGSNRGANGSGPTGQGVNKQYGRQGLRAQDPYVFV